MSFDWQWAAVVTLQNNESSFANIQLEFEGIITGAIFSVGIT